MFPIFVSAYIQPICLPPPNLNVRATIGKRNLTAAGWGFTKARSDINDLLQSIDLPLQADSRCRAAHPSQYLDNQVIQHLNYSNFVFYTVIYTLENKRYS